MSHEPKSTNVNDTIATYFPDREELEKHEFRCIKSICQNLSSLNQENLHKVPKLTKELIFGNLKSYENIVTTIKCLAKYQNDKITILNNNVIVIERKLKANNSVPFVKYQITLINDEDDDSEDEDDDECGDNKSDNDVDHDDNDKNDLRKCMFGAPRIFNYNLCQTINCNTQKINQNKNNNNKNNNNVIRMCIDLLF